MHSATISYLMRRVDHSLLNIFRKSCAVFFKYIAFDFCLPKNRPIIWLFRLSRKPRYNLFFFFVFKLDINVHMFTLNK